MFCHHHGDCIPRFVREESIPTNRFPRENEGEHERFIRDPLDRFLLAYTVTFTSDHNNNTWFQEAQRSTIATRSRCV